MELRKICDDTKDMGMWELAHNMAFVKNGEVWYRDFERELTARDLVREIYRKYVTTEATTGQMKWREFALFSIQFFGARRNFENG